MSENIGIKYVHNGKLRSRSAMLVPSQYTYLLYEVIRTIDCTPLFLEEHFARLQKSFDIVKGPNPGYSSFSDDINLLIASSPYSFGNIKIAYYIVDGKTERYAYYIKHAYPTETERLKGVILKSVQASRENPNAKMVHSNLREKVASALLDKAVYEVLLVNGDMVVTEGGRSNVFFVKGDALYTAPDSMVLQGITRLYTINIANALHIPVHQIIINYKALPTFDAAFITGTSPKILPIRAIDGFAYNAAHSIINKLLAAYNETIDNYITLHKR